MKERERKADEAIAKLAEANFLMAEAKKKEDAANAKEADMNERNVKLTVDARRLADRITAFDMREHKLSEREANIKLLEKEIYGKG